MQAIYSTLLMDDSYAAARDRSITAFCVGSACRGDDARNLRLCMIGCPIRFRCVGPCPMFIIPILANVGKTLADASDYRVISRHVDPLMCPQGATGFGLMSRFTLHAEPAPDMNDKERWRKTYLYPSATSPLEPLSYKTQCAAAKRVQELNDIEVVNPTHCLRKTGIRIMDAAGVPQAAIQRVSHQNTGSLSNNYLLQFSPQALVAAGGWPSVAGNDYDMYFHPRFLMFPTASIVHCVFPMIEQLQQQIVERKARGEISISQTAFVAAVQYLAVVVYQDSLDMLYTGVALDELGECTNPCIKRLLGNEDFCVRLQHYTELIQNGVSICKLCVKG